jgi:glycine/D-amino acid oxidase-like deaminating enzyme
VRTPRGEIRARIVVDAAGAWLRRVAALGGSTVKLVPTRHQLMITVPLPGVRPEQPITRIIDANVYVRPDKGGLMLGGYEPDPVQYDMAALPESFGIDDMPLDLSVLRRLAESVAAQFPIFRDIALQEHRGGLPTMTADGEHVVGPAPGLSGLYVIGGCCVGGLTTAPALGELLAEWITQGRASPDLALMAPDRMATGIAEDELRELCRLQYAHHYWSPETMPSGVTS